MIALALCISCMRYHEPPIPCGFDSTKPCLTCGKSVGYRWSEANGERAGRLIECWSCWAKQQWPGSVPA
jgi:hypothetical protein